jgi:hypothetical protein
MNSNHWKMKFILLFLILLPGDLKSEAQQSLRPIFGVFVNLFLNQSPIKAMAQIYQFFSFQILRHHFLIITLEGQHPLQDHQQEKISQLQQPLRLKLL